MSTPRLDAVTAAHAKLVGRLEAGVFEGERLERALGRKAEYENSMKLLKGATNRRDETPSVGRPGVTIDT